MTDETYESTRITRVIEYSISRLLDYHVTLRYVILGSRRPLSERNRKEEVCFCLFPYDIVVHFVKFAVLRHLFLINSTYILCNNIYLSGVKRIGILTRKTVEAERV